ncbi:DUF1643 domain-containing protein [Cyclobacterium salsum]|uniref:DUF1643 domain-containing protein n=1 Tax=Cyclobacterium salsum TaxID=2666329 RepID=UPI001390A892|nr:DUF1643 domain-containing protein [Cyclobacterium salsum]
MVKSAKISSCEKYRYTLTRIWETGKPLVLFVMLNPSTADATKDDRTITRCIGFSKSWGYGGLHVCNLFAFRATKPKDLLICDNPFGDENIDHIRQLIDKVDKVICAWGNRKLLKKLLNGQKGTDLISFAKGKLYAIDLGKNGTPKHPLYLKSDLLPVRLKLDSQF